MARYGMIIDATTCLGCNSCTVACIEENQTAYWEDKVRTKVYEKEIGKFPETDKIYQSQICVHCENAPCVTVCPTGASHYGLGGTVQVDAEKCILCGACIEACPYEARYFYNSKDVEIGKQEYGDLTSNLIPHVDKCTLCVHRLEQDMEPACVATCIGESRIFVDWDNLTPEQEALAKKSAPLFHGDDYKPKIRYIIDNENIVPEHKSGLSLWLWHYLAKPLGLLSMAGILGVLGFNFLVTKPQVDKLKKEQHHEEGDNGNDDGKEE